ncbi:hypothetical protein G4B88_023377 [Cannabis sativa]|uniref:Uncharacterized protein n=1 Tax=Cannabis sativa TaxID=3483 RepID=A0A7J6HZ61_CANSA|nr:hypothetical protein G4B88_023377 [Cannabis sativa]
MRFRSRRRKKKLPEAALEAFLVLNVLTTATFREIKRVVKYRVLGSAVNNSKKVTDIVDVWAVGAGLLLLWSTTGGLEEPYMFELFFCTHAYDQ